MDFRHLINTERLILREIQESDVTERYQSWFRDEEVKKWITSAAEPPMLLDLRSYVLHRVECKDVLFWGIFDKTTGLHIGNIKYEPVNSEQGYAIMGILIGDPIYRGIGVAAEALIASALWLKNNRNIQQIILGVSKNNHSAIRAYEKVGFIIADTPHIKATPTVNTMIWSLYENTHNY